VKFTIITTTLNCINTIEQTINSVHMAFNNFEHIIIDAGSNDGTLQILSKYKHLIVLIEQGISIPNAWNLGITISTGDYIGLLNGDDYYSNNIETELIKTIHQFPKHDILIGNVILVDSMLVNIRKFNASIPNQYNMLLGLPFLHPSVFVKNEYYKNNRLFKTNRIISFDSDWLLYAIKKKAVFVKYDSITYMRNGGISVISRWVGFGEYIQSLFDYNYNKYFISFYIFIKSLTIIKKKL